MALCGAVGDEVTDKEPIIDDIQHDYKYVAETCANGGIAAHYECSICGEIAKLEAELAYQQKFLNSVRAKLSNERFVSNAPEAVVAVERKKESDSLSKIESLTASLNVLKNN